MYFNYSHHVEFRIVAQGRTALDTENYGKKR